jgi:hypothetical protein
MTLADSLLESLSAWQTTGDGRHLHRHLAGDWSVELTADRVDSVGCACWELTVSRAWVNEPQRNLRQWAERIATRTTGLLESLQVIEVDDEKNEAILRSSKPSKKADIAQYYEVHLFGMGLATVRRYAADIGAGTRREQVSFVLTNEVIAKLADDLIAE